MHFFQGLAIHREELQLDFFGHLFCLVWYMQDTKQSLVLCYLRAAQLKRHC